MRIFAFREFAIHVFVGVLVRLIDIISIQIGYPGLDMPLGYDVGYSLIIVSGRQNFCVQPGFDLVNGKFIRILNHK